MTIAIDENLSLEKIAQQHAVPLFYVIDQNREHLSRFLPWVGNMKSSGDVSAYISHCETLQTLQQEISFVIVAQDKIVGRIGLHHISTANKSGAIGYWLSSTLQGKGIVTKACRSVIQLGFDQLQLNRIEIKAAVANTRSQAIPEKLGFVKEGVLRQAEMVNDKYVDLVLYSLLKDDL